MACRCSNVRLFPRQPRALTTGARVAKILNQIWRAPPSGAGVLALSENGKFFQGRRLPKAFVWQPANEEVYAAFKCYCDKSLQEREAA